MIALSTIEDILDADETRQSVGIPPLLTQEGRQFFTKLFFLMREQRLSQVPQEIALLP